LKRLAAGFVLLAPAGSAIAPAGAPAIRARVSPAVTPCVQAAAKSYEASRGAPVVVETGALPGEGAADVYVGANVELTRVLEGGTGVIDSDVDIAFIPWVLSVSGSGPKVRTLSELSRSDTEIVLLAGPAAYEARRALAGQGALRLRETTDPAALRAAPVAVVPLSLAGPGEHNRLDVPPIRVTAAVAAQAARPEAGRAFIAFLGSEAGQKAFALCGLASSAR
jgi:hypothetical protein